jgi:enamine deaminase RidA (YjgF/YER057c/UK114 family)
MEIVPGGVEAQTEQALKNLKAVVEAGGSELGKVVKTTVREKKKHKAPSWSYNLFICRFS